MHRQKNYADLGVKIKEKPCTLQGFYDLVYYELVSQEYRHRSEQKKKVNASLSFDKEI